MSLTLIILWIILIASSLWDLKTWRIPNLLTLTGWLSILLVQGFCSGRFPWTSLGISLLFSLPLLVCAVLSRGKLGMGDVKLCLSIGAAMGLPDSWKALFFGSLTALFFILVREQKQGTPKEKAIPFAPFLTAGVLIQLMQSGFHAL